MRQEPINERKEEENVKKKKKRKNSTKAIDQFRYIKILDLASTLGNKTKELVFRLSNEYYISFVSFLLASEPSMNFDISKLVYYRVKCSKEKFSLVLMKTFL